MGLPRKRKEVPTQAHSVTHRGLGTLGGGGGWSGSDPQSPPIFGGRGGGKVQSTIRIKKCHDLDQKVHLPIYEQHNKPMVLFEFSVSL